MQQVKLHNDRFSLRYVDIGVPQGSVLGTTLLLIYINDMLQYIKHPSSLVVSYADDTNFLIRCSTIANAENTAIEIYHRLTFWIEKNKLCINSDKTVSILFKTPQSKLPNVEQLRISQTSIINYSGNTKMLGY